MKDESTVNHSFALISWVSLSVNNKLFGRLRIRTDKWVNATGKILNDLTQNILKYYETFDATNDSNKFQMNFNINHWTL